jgi:LCP family protein required for cell wall assembly
MVERPACGDNDEIPGAKYAQWNVAYSRGGAACTVEQFELNTGVRVDETITVDFSGFKGMVNAIGGVPMCVPYDIRDPKTKAFIPKGEREMKGQEALDYVRLRYIGTGSDIDRITRQQTFVASMVNKTVSKGTLARVDKVYKFLNAATKSLTVSEGLSDLTQLAKLGVSLNGVGLDQIQFLTVPNEPWVENPNRIAWTEDAATLWKKIGKDKPLTAEFTGDAIKADKGQTSEAPAPSTSSSPSVSPSASAGPQEGESEASEAEQAADREQARREAEAKGLCG